MKGKQGWGSTIRCEESSPLYWEVYHEMRGTKPKSKDTNIKKRGRFSNKTK